MVVLKEKRGEYRMRVTVVFRYIYDQMIKKN